MSWRISGMVIEPGTILWNEVKGYSIMCLFLDRNKPNYYIVKNLLTGVISSIDLDILCDRRRYSFKGKEYIDINSPMFKALYEV